MQTVRHRETNILKGFHLANRAVAVSFAAHRGRYDTGVNLLLHAVLRHLDLEILGR